MNDMDLRAQARRTLPRFVFDFIDGGADAESCLVRNTADLAKVTLLPRVLRDVRDIDTSVTLFGEKWRYPLAIAPTGFNGLIRPDADLELARAAARCDIPFVQSTASNVRIERVAAESNGMRWMQLYVMGGRQLAERIVGRANEAACSALVLTVDVAVGGNRERDVRNGMKMPFRFSPRTMLDVVAHPRWAARFVGQPRPDFVNLTEPNAASLDPALAAALGNREMDRSVAWDNIGWLRRLWDKPLILKGVLHPADARLAVDAGFDGIIVSNHGGRQLDSAPSAISALPAVVDAVDGRVAVLVDNGFRRGDDVAKALALGAQAVLIGRPLLWGVTRDGESGASSVIERFGTELRRAMTLLGARNLEELRQVESTIDWSRMHTAVSTLRSVTTGLRGIR